MQTKPNLPILGYMDCCDYKRCNSNDDCSAYNLVSVLGNDDDDAGNGDDNHVDDEHTNNDHLNHHQTCIANKCDH